MPMPRLLKRLSEKNIRKRAQSEHLPERSNSDPVPPLPPPKSPHRNVSFQIITPPSTLGSLERHSMPSLLPDDPVTLPKSNLSAQPLVPPTRNGIGKGDIISRELNEVWIHMASKDSTSSRTDMALQRIEGEVLIAERNRPGTTTAVTAVKTILDATGGMQAIERGVNSFLEGSAILMKTLDEVGKIHPFIGVAVMAFKAVYTLEMKRRENDKKIIALHVEMKDMMSALVQLRDVSKSDVEDFAPDGSTIKSRLVSLVHQTANDIKDCANACDTYSKKKLLVKVLKGPVWEGRLVAFVGLFTKRRSEFEFALAVHTARGVDAANKTLGDVDQTTREMNAKMDLMMKMFQRFVPSEEKEMAKLVDQKGGVKACQNDDKTLQELSNLESKSRTTAPATGRKSGAKTSDLEDLKDDLHVDPDVAIEKNMAVFSRKFEVQKRQIVQEMSLIVKREGDRVISAVTAGPHDKIIDPDVHQIWKDMGWRGSVKARHFVMALRDHFHEKWATDHKLTPTGGTPHTSISEKSDDWALPYLDIVTLQPISEAFDDDASGFVTVAEANTFTASRPLGWSLPHWLAYWAIGWHQTLVDYAEQIGEIIAKMFAILPKILHPNLTAVNLYLTSVYDGIVTLQLATTPSYLSDALQAKFRSHVEAEEERLKGNLEAVKYDIDAPDTLALVTGPGRIERFVFPLLYLLLKRHFEVFRLSCSMHPHPDELDDAADTIRYVFEAVNDRVEILRSIFKQQKLDPTQEFQTFSHGLFAYHSESSGQWAPEVVKRTDPPEVPYDDTTERHDIQVYSILNYPMDQDERDSAAYEIPTPRASVPFAETSPLSDVAGLWHGYSYWKWDTVSAGGMMSADFCITSLEGERLHFQASGRSDASNFKIVGQCTPGSADNLVNVKFTRTFPIRYPAEYWHGQLDKDTNTISGTCGGDPDHRDHWKTFVLKRTAPEQLCFFPAPQVFNDNKPRALWAFALGAIAYQVRRKSWSWGFFRERRDKRKRFIDLYIRATEFGPNLDENEIEEYGQLRGSFTTADSRFYHSLAQYRIRRTVKHAYACDHCAGLIGGARLICLICQSNNVWRTVDVCETPDCLVARVEREDLDQIHLPTHDMVKVRRVVHTRQLGKLCREAKSALQKARTIFERSQPSLTQPPLTPFPQTPIIQTPRPRSLPWSDNVTKFSDRAKKRASTIAKAMLRCAACMTSVTQPCWYCVHCKEDTFICDDCDAKGTESLRDHNDTHALVRCQPSVKVVHVSLEDRLARVERLLESLILKIGNNAT